MVHTQYQQFIATVLLGSVFLHSCGNPSWKLEAEDSPDLGAKTDSPKKFPDDTSSQSPRLSKDSKKQVFVETSTAYSELLDGVVHEAYGDRGSPSSPTPTHNLVLTTTPPHMPNRPSPRPLHVTTLGSSGHIPVSTQHITKNLQYMVCDAGYLAGYNPPQYAISPVVTSLAPPRHSVPLKSVAFSIVTKSELSPLYQSPSLKSSTEAIASLSTPIGPFVLASGQELLFSLVGAYWQALVTDMWGTFSRQTTLPVIGKEDVSIALHNLQGQKAVYTQRRIHILETDQPPWAPRVVYVGAIGLRGGMEKKAKQVQEKTDLVHASKTIEHVAVADLPFHETSEKEQYAQGLLSNESPTAWHPPFVAREVPTSVLSPLLQDHLQPYAQSVSRTQLAEEAKLPSIPRVTAFSTPEEAQSAVETYLERWSLETPSGRAVICKQGQGILKNVEALKKSTKRSYRQQVLGFEMHDIDPLVWNRVLKQQQATKEQLKALRGLRTRLLAVFQRNGPALKEVGIQTTIPVAVGEAAFYSSDEDEQQLSDQSRRNHAAFVVGIGKVLQGRIEELLALLDDAIGTTLAPYIALLSSTPALPDLLEDYTANFLHETDDEAHKAELLGSLLAEVILQFVPLPKVKKVQLNKLKHKLGQAAQRVALQYANQSKKLPRKKIPK